MKTRFARPKPATLLSFALVSLSVSSCAFFAKESEPKPAVPVTMAYTAESPVIKLPTDQGRVRVTVTGLSGESVFLVKCNGAPYDATEGSTGMIEESTVERSIARSADDVPSGSFVLKDGMPGSGAVSIGGVTRRDPARSASFRLPAAGQSREAVTLTVAEQLAKPPAGYVPYTASAVGAAKKTFYVEGPSSIFAPKWTTATATLRGFGKHCLVWVADENYKTADGESVTDSKIADIVSNFDKLYYPETALLGYEYGGGLSPTDPAYGGADGEERVNIFVYDIEYDYEGFETQDSGVVGYFWAKDLFPRESDPASLVGTTSSNFNVISNVGEIFYIDAHFLYEYPKVAYSTLAHEFQHMINFNQKNVALDIASDVPIWYNEMLSLMAEDVLASVIGIGIGDDDHPAARMALFNYYYTMAGLTYWDPDYPGAYSYPFAYAFGAYLARNYGGAELLEALLANDSVGIDSVSGALAAVGSSADFSVAFQRFGEALVFHGSGPATVNSFSRTPEEYRLSLPDGTVQPYNFDRFDIWDISYQVEGTTYYGPWICKSSSYPIKQYGVFLESVYDLQDIHDSVTFDVLPPSDPDVSMYIMVNTVD